jgi:hypothetical protein
VIDVTLLSKLSWNEMRIAQEFGEWLGSGVSESKQIKREQENVKMDVTMLSEI